MINLGPAWADCHGHVSLLEGRYPKINQPSSLAHHGSVQESLLPKLPSPKDGEKTGSFSREAL